MEMAQSLFIEGKKLKQALLISNDKITHLVSVKNIIKELATFIIPEFPKVIFT